jgi:hypothetical protein
MQQITFYLIIIGLEYGEGSTTLCDIHFLPPRGYRGYTSRIPDIPGEGRGRWPFGASTGSFSVYTSYSGTLETSQGWKYR